MMQYDQVLFISYHTYDDWIVCRYEKMQQCWHFHPEERPDFSDLKVFFDDILHSSVKQVCLRDLTVLVNKNDKSGY